MSHMHVLFMKLTAAGAKDLEAALAAVDATRADLLAPLEIREESFLVTMGEFDLITVFEVADTSAAAFYALELARTGYVTTHTVCGFTPGDLKAAVAQIKLTRGS